MNDATTTKEDLLDLAQELAQTRGLNAFSFQDLARGVGISTASVHHHFSTKADLARELMARYRATFQGELALLDRDVRSPRRKLERLAGLFRQTLRRGNRLCLCGMFAAEYTTLPGPVRQEVRMFYSETEAWLKGVLDEGRRSGVFKLGQPAAAMARTILATLEGAMVAARTFDDERRLTQAAHWLIASVDANSGPRGG